MPLVDPAVAAERYAHGTRARYMLGRCRCFPCRVANADYEQARLEAQKLPWRVRHIGGDYWIVCSTSTGQITLKTKSKRTAFRRRDKLNAGAPVDERPTQLVETGDVCAHVALLQKYGIGYKRIAQLARVNSGVLFRIMKGDIQHTRRAAAERILAVTISSKAQGASVGAGPTWKLLDDLIARGCKRTWLARQLGSRARTPSLQIRRDYVRVSTAVAVRRLYHRLTAKVVQQPVVRSPRANTALRVHQETCFYYAEGASSQCAHCRRLAAAA